MSTTSVSPVLIKSWILNISGYLTQHAALMAANALVGSQLDYYKSLFRRLSALNLQKLQCVQISLSTVNTNTTKYSHITLVGKSHWWLIEHCPKFKTASLVYKIQESGNPVYVVPFLKPNTLEDVH